jgi:hypothetical protein
MRTRRLSDIDWTDAPADLNGLVRFAERRNLVSARVPSHFKRSLPRLCHGRFISSPFKFVLHHSVYRLMYSSAGVFHATIATFACFLLIQRFLSVFPSNCTLSPVEGSSAKRSTLADKFQGFVPAADSTLHVFLVIAGYYSDYFYLKPHNALNVRPFRG